jgi:hypothetical protein
MVEDDSQPADDYNFSVEMGMVNITYGETFSYIRESYQQLRE